MPEFIAAFDALSVSRMEALINSAATFSKYYLMGMELVTQTVKSKAGEKAFAPVGLSVPGPHGHTGGTLKKGLRGFARSPFIGVVGVIQNVPYARRREYTFDGQKDSLGRYFPMDPRPDTIGTEGLKRDHIMYIHRAIKDTEPLIMVQFRLAAQLAIIEMARGAV